MFESQVRGRVQFIKGKGAWLAQSGERVTFDLEGMSLSSALGVKPPLKKKKKK